MLNFGTWGEKKSTCGKKTSTEGTKNDTLFLTGNNKFENVVKQYF